MSTSIHIERVYPHPPEKVWGAITDAGVLARWLMPNDFEPRVGHRFTFRTDPAPGFDGIVHCEVLELDEPRKLAFAWKGGPVDTIVTFQLEAVEGGTRFRMEQAGFRGVRAWLVSRILKSGCRTIYGERLPEVLAELDADSRPLDEIEDEACMNVYQRAVAKVVGLFGRSWR